MSSNLIIHIVGAGGHSRSVIELLSDNNINTHGIFDDTFSKKKEEKISGVPLVGTLRQHKDERLVLAIGDNTKRAEAFNLFAGHILEKSIFASSVILADNCQLGASNLIFHQAVINAHAVIGNNNIINTACILEHESMIGSHNHLSIGCIIAGRVKVGSNCFIGAGAIIIEGLSICDNVTIGAGSVVIKDITIPGTYVGNPARRIE